MNDEEAGRVLAETLNAALSIAPILDRTLKKLAWLSFRRLDEKQRVLYLNFASIAAFDHAIFSHDVPKDDERSRVMDALRMIYLRMCMPVGRRFAHGGIDALESIFSDIGMSLSEGAFFAPKPEEAFRCGAYRLYCKCADLVHDEKAPKDLMRFIQYYPAACETYFGWAKMFNERWPSVHAAARCFLSESGVKY